MSETFTLVIENQPVQTDIDVIDAGLTEYNRFFISADARDPLSVILRDGGCSVAGGVVGRTGWGWLYVDMLWVRDDLRGQGYGQRLLSTIEREALKRGCSFAYLDTFSFQALPFYQKNGYEVFGELPNFPEGYTRYFLKKVL